MKREQLENGYTITRSKGGFWNIWKPEGGLYMTCISYAEAHEIASHLTNRWY